MSFFGNVFGGIKDTITNTFAGSGNAAQLSQAAFKVGTPFADQRDYYAGLLKTLMSDPASEAKDPSYKFGMDQGLEAVMRRMSATGLGGSGNELIELEKFGQDYASGHLQQQEAFLAQLAGAQITPNTSSAVQAQHNSSSAGMGLLGDLGKGLGSLLGGAKGGSSIGGGSSSGGGGGGDYGFGDYGGSSGDFGGDSGGSGDGGIGFA